MKNAHRMDIAFFDFAFLIRIWIKVIRTHAEHGSDFFCLLIQVVIRRIRANDAFKHFPLLIVFFFLIRFISIPVLVIFIL